MRILETDDVVLDFDDRGGACLNVVFSAYTKLPQRWPLFQRQIKDAGQSGLFITAKGNHWYQVPGIHDLIEKAVQLSKGYDRVCSMGSSMGGYAALYFAGALGATSALAVSPQVSVSAEVETFDRRWIAESREIKFWLPPMAAENCPCPAVLLYDNHHSADREHVRRIAEIIETELVELPFSGHPPSFCLQEIGCIPWLFSGAGEVGAMRQAMQKLRQEFAAKGARSAIALANRALSLKGDARREFLSAINLETILSGPKSKERLTTLIASETAQKLPLHTL